MGSFVTEVGDSGNEPFLHELCMKAVELTTIAQVRTKDLCAEALRGEYPLLFTSSVGTAKCATYEIELSDTTPVR